MKSKSIILNGKNLSINQVILISRYHRKVERTKNRSIEKKISQSCKRVDEIIEKKKHVYGVTTNFGGLANSYLNFDEQDIIDLQKNLIWGLKCGVGNPIAEHHVRAGIIIRINSLLHGVSGIRIEIIDRLIQFLNKGITPVVYEYGSIGASGDLVPYAYIAGAITGLDKSFKVTYKNRVMNCTEVLKKFKMKPIQLRPKEGLALLNGSGMMAGIASNCVHNASKILQFSLVINAFFVQAISGREQAFDSFIHLLKPHPGQIWVANMMKALLKHSKLVFDTNNQLPEEELIQDRYSMRCLPQYLGVVYESITTIRDQIYIEINSASDNPLCDSKTGTFYHAGNFLGQHMSFAMDQLRLSLSLVIKHLDVQVASLVTPEFSNHLPASLVGHSKKKNQLGLKGLQICANSLMPSILYNSGSLCNRYATHAEQFNQNINSLGYTSSLLTWDTIVLCYRYLAIAIIFAIQSVELRTHTKKSHYDASSLIAPSLLPFYDTVYLLLIKKKNSKKPLIWKGAEQQLDHYVQLLTNDLLDSHSQLFESIKSVFKSDFKA